MAITAQYYEVFFSVGAALTASHDVVDLKVFSPATLLAAPAISLEHLQRELVVSPGVETITPL